MVRPERSVLAAALLGATLLCSCAPALHPVERALIRGGAADEPMALVRNDDPAGDELLRTVSARLALGEPLLELLASRMLATVRAAPGVGLAAVQVGVPRRLVLVQRLDLPDKPFVAMVDPRIVASGPRTEPGWEGCLSVPEIYASVLRASELTVVYRDTEGRRHRERIRGFTAVIVQHEIDHLDGTLFIDRMTPGTQISRDEYLEIRRREREGGGP